MEHRLLWDARQIAPEPRTATSLSSMDAGVDNQARPARVSVEAARWSSVELGGARGALQVGASGAGRGRRGERLRDSSAPADGPAIRLELATHYLPPPLPAATAAASLSAAPRALTRRHHCVTVLNHHSLLSVVLYASSTRGLYTSTAATVAEL